MRRTILMAAASAASLAFIAMTAIGYAPTAEAQTGATSTMGQSQAVVTTGDFVKKAAISDMFEIQAAQLAQSQSKSAEIKAFAARMVRDHTKSTAALKAILSTTNQTGLAPSAIDSEHMTMLSELKTGRDFDETYVHQQVMAHEDAVALFKSYSASGEDPQIKKFAAQTLPTIEDHLSMIQKISAGLAGVK
ncbi:MAG TPA: DUF4142 domain-containing protein [Rhizomicrobium sp.]|nr:DUF4142 domain-containing protein [Rhizomicrobium sp.]